MSIDANFTLKMPLNDGGRESEETQQNSLDNSAEATLPSGENDPTTFTLKDPSRSPAEDDQMLREEFEDEEEEEEEEEEEVPEEEERMDQAEATFVIGQSAPILVPAAPSPGPTAAAVPESPAASATTTFTIDPKGNLKQQFARLGFQQQPKEPATSGTQKATTSSNSSSSPPATVKVEKSPEGGRRPKVLDCTRTPCNHFGDFMGNTVEKG
jgi:hypothetical protein